MESNIKGDIFKPQENRRNSSFNFDPKQNGKELVKLKSSTNCWENFR